MAATGAKADLGVLTAETGAGVAGGDSTPGEGMGEAAQTSGSW